MPTEFLCFPPLSKMFFGRCMTRPYKRTCHQTNFFNEKIVKKISFFLFSFSISYFLPFVFFLLQRGSIGCMPYVFFYKGFGRQLEFHLTIQDEIWCYLQENSLCVCYSCCNCSLYVSNNNKMNMCSDTSVKTTSCKCCMHASGIV